MDKKLFFGIVSFLVLTAGGMLIWQLWYTPVVPSVDLKINGYENPPEVLYNSIFIVSWTSTGVVSCSAFGSYAPLVEGGLWTDLVPNLTTFGSKQAYARNQNITDTDFLQIGIQCFDANGKAVEDLALLLIKNGSENNTTVACPQDAKQCLDGSYVSRTGPDCAFAECPKDSNKICGLNDIGEKYNLSYCDRNCSEDKDCYFTCGCGAINNNEGCYDDGTIFDCVTHYVKCEDNICIYTEEEVSGDETVNWQKYTNTEYGFELKIPNNWIGFNVLSDRWDGGNYQGPEIIIRHPKWEWAENKIWQDVPILIFTSPEWKLVGEEKIIISAAPIGPSKIGENNKYIFALPPRWIGFTNALGQNDARKIIQTFKAF